MLLILIGAVLLVPSVVSDQKLLRGNNACKTLEDYSSLRTNPNCWHNPDIVLRAPALIRKYTGDYEEHHVTTEDGYILSIMRMKRENPKGVVLLVPTMFTDAKMFMLQGNESTALLLWRAGYDIWFYNTRGTAHSEGHVNMSLTDYEYWDFTFTELGYYDLSSAIQTVKNKTGTKIFVYGTSLASTIALVYSSMRPEESQNSVNAFMMAGTSYYFKYATSPLVTIAPYIVPPIEELAKNLGLGNCIPAINTVELVCRYLYRIPAVLQLNNFILLWYFGWTPQEIDHGLINTDIAMLIRDTSIKMAFHYAQIELTKTRFQQYDYGKRENKRRYGTPQPPEFPLRNITTPLFLLISDSDALTSQKDTETLWTILRDEAKIYKPVYIKGMNHADYHYGKHRKEMIIDNLLKFLEHAGK